MDLSGICKLSKKKHKKYIISLIFVLVFDYLLFPLPILAKEEFKNQKFQTITDFKSETADIKDDQVEAKVLAEKAIIILNKVVMDHGSHSMTAYTSEAAQTDSDPCTTANGYNLCKAGVIEDTIAANFLKFGTKVKLPGLFGDRVFVVRDRMNSRYPERVDVWFKSKPAALKFGLKYSKVVVVE